MIRSFVAQAARAAALASLHLPLAAQTLVITGTREPLATESLAADVVVIERERIAASTADSVADLLRREAGVQLTRSGGPGQNAGVLVRGASSGQTVVLVDGVRVGSATLGLPSLEGLGLGTIERIEVLRGPGSSVHGADAIGGVVQIFTRRGDAAPRLDAQVAVGGYGATQASLAASGRAGDWDLAAALAHEGNDGVSALRPGDLFGNYNPDADGYRLDSAQAQIGLRPAAGHRIGLAVLHSRLNAQYDASEFLPPSFTQDNTADFRNRLDTRVGALDWRGEYGSALVASARLARSIDDLESGGRQTERFRTTRDQAGVQIAWNTGVAGQLVAAFDHLEEKAASTSFVADVSRRDRAALLSLTGAAAGWSWQGDLRHDRYSDFGGVTTGRLGAGYALAPGWRARALAGTTFRAPSFNDLYFPGFGVATLEPERGQSVEAGVEWRQSGSEAAATVYRNRIHDLVAYEPDRSFCPPEPAYDFGCARNVDRARLQGATLSGRHRQGALALAATIDFLDAKNEATGARLPRRAAHQENLSAGWDGGAWTAGAALLHVGSRPDAGKTLAAETTLDLKAAWKFASGWALEAKLLNATDTDLEPARDYQGLGRQGWIVVRYTGGF